MFIARRSKVLGLLALSFSFVSIFLFTSPAFAGRCVDWAVDGQACKNAPNRGPIGSLDLWVSGSSGGGSKSFESCHTGYDSGNNQIGNAELEGAPSGCSVTTNSVDTSIGSPTNMNQWGSGVAWYSMSGGSISFSLSGNCTSGTVKVWHAYSGNGCYATVSLGGSSSDDSTWDDYQDDEPDEPEDEPPSYSFSADASASWASDTNNVLGGTMKVNFSHSVSASIYSWGTGSLAVSSVSAGWSVSRACYLNDSAISCTGNSASGTATFTSSTSQTVNTSTLSHTADSYGTYKFCETISSSSYSFTSDTACVSVTYTAPSGTFTPSSSVTPTSTTDPKFGAGQSVAFTHSITLSSLNLGSASSVGVDWSVSRSCTKDGSAISCPTPSVVSPSTGSWTGLTADGSTTASSHTHTYTFSSAGTYVICETLTLSGNSSGTTLSSNPSSACSTFTVQNPTGTFTPSSSVSPTSISEPKYDSGQSITFTHSITLSDLVLHSANSVGVSWSVSRSCTKDSAAYDCANLTSNAVSPSSGSWTGQTANGSTTANTHTHTYKFHDPGTYTICETFTLSSATTGMSISSSNPSSACTTVTTVDPEGTFSPSVSVSPTSISGGDIKIYETGYTNTLDFAFTHKISYTAITLHSANSVTENFTASLPYALSNASYTTPSDSHPYGTSTSGTLSFTSDTAANTVTTNTRTRRYQFTRYGTYNVCEKLTLATPYFDSNRTTANLKADPSEAEACAEVKVEKPQGDFTPHSYIGKSTSSLAESDLGADSLGWASGKSYTYAGESQNLSFRHDVELKNLVLNAANYVKVDYKADFTCGHNSATSGATNFSTDCNNTTYLNSAVQSHARTTSYEIKSSGTYNLISAHNHNLTFKKPGTYQICETFTLSTTATASDAFTELTFTSNPSKRCATVVVHASNGEFTSTSSARFQTYYSILDPGSQVGSKVGSASSQIDMNSQTWYILPYNYRVSVGYTHDLHFAGNMGNYPKAPTYHLLKTNFSTGPAINFPGSWSVFQSAGIKENYTANFNVATDAPHNYTLNAANGYTVPGDTTPGEYDLKDTVSYSPKYFYNDATNSGSGSSTGSVHVQLIDLLSSSNSGVMVKPGVPTPQNCTSATGSRYTCLEPNNTNDTGFEFTGHSYPGNSTRNASVYYTSNSPFTIQFRHRLQREDPMREDRYNYPLRINYAVGGFQSITSTFFTLEKPNSTSTTTLESREYNTNSSNQTAVGNFRRFCENINYYTKKLTLAGQGVAATGYSKVCKIVYNPYNFQTTPITDPTYDDKIIELNGSTDTTVEVRIDPTTNPVTDYNPTTGSQGPTYETMTTPDIKAVVIPYVAYEDATVYAGTTVPGTGDPCTYFENYFKSVSNNSLVGPYQTKNNCKTITENTTLTPDETHKYTTSFANPAEEHINSTSNRKKVFCYVVAVNYDNLGNAGSPGGGTNGFNATAAYNYGNQTGESASASANGYINYDSLKRWRYSDPICNSNYGKHFNLQIWGGSLFSAGNVTTPLSHRTTNGTNINSAAAPNKTYGSWAELSTIMGSVGTNTPTLIGFASGASLGYSSARKGASPSLTGTSGRTTEDSIFCRDVTSGSKTFRLATPLSIPNASCDSSTYKLNGYIPLYRSGPYSALSARYIATSQASGNRTGSVDLSNPGQYTVKSSAYGDARYTYSPSTLTVSASSRLPHGTTHIVVAEGDITIAGNLSYESLGHSSIDSIPQYLIVSKNGNINIKNNVGNIDAWLIAPNGHVNTCVDGNLGTNSVGLVTGLNNCKATGLKITGSVLTQSILPYRAYGSGTSMNTDPDYASIPAETIDYNGLTYLWGYAQSAHHSAVVTSTYQVSLPPRY